ncbi:MAG: hypothetical protein ACLP1Q_21295 [Solirubrobacteraceae bacterium]
MSPPVSLLDQLADARRAGKDFADVWPHALTAALSDAPDDERDDWQAALDGTAERWREAFERQPARRADAALRVLHDPERETLPDCPRGCCQHCFEPIPAGKKRSARFCCDECRRDWHHTREAAERAAA